MLKVFVETNNDLYNDVLIVEKRGEKRSKPRDQISVEMSCPNRNLIKNHPPKKIIERKDKGVMTRKKVNEEICLISQVEPKSVDESCKDNHRIQAMK